MGNGEMELTNEESEFLEAHGFKQLTSIYAMHRQQDTNLWTLTGMFAATNGVLIVALFQIMGKTAGEYWLQMSLGAIGLILCLCWFVSAIRATTRAWDYKRKAAMLQLKLSIPKEYQIWKGELERDPELKPLPGIKSVNLYWPLVLMFSIVWACSAFYGSSHIEELEPWPAVFTIALVWIAWAIMGSTYLAWRREGKKRV